MVLDAVDILVSLLTSRHRTRKRLVGIGVFVGSRHHAASNTQWSSSDRQKTGRKTATLLRWLDTLNTYQGKSTKLRQKILSVRSLVLKMAWKNDPRVTCLSLWQLHRKLNEAILLGWHGTNWRHSLYNNNILLFSVLYDLEKITLRCLQKQQIF